MSGFVGYVGTAEAAPRLLEGLRRLEHRGYDSSGIATLSGRPARTQVRRSKGRVKSLDAVLKAVPTEGHIGLAHTRWATPGTPRVENAHPHHVDGVTVVHNGIFENADLVRAELAAMGRTFSSETDTEVLAHLLVMQSRSLPLSTRLHVALSRLEGSWAVGVVDETVPSCLAFARSGSPLVLGRGPDGIFVASDATALVGSALDVLVLEDGDSGCVIGSEVQVIDKAGAVARRVWQPNTAQESMLDRGPHAHHMRKEIDEQPRAFRDTLLRAFDSDAITMLGIDHAWLVRARRVVLVACGSSHHAAQVARRSIEATASVDVRVELASEWRHHGRVDAETLVIGISQSGETVDTLGALDEARRRGAGIAAITNVEGSAITRLCADSGGSFVTAAGPEIGVASTKAFITQIVALRVLGLAMARARGLMSAATIRSEALAVLRTVEELRVLPAQDAHLQALAERIHGARSMLYLGRGPLHALALEGALKMTEISYIHAQGFAAGEMKHGPIALIEAGIPVVVLVPRGPLRPKVLANLAEVKSRGAFVIAVCEAGDADVAAVASEVVTVAEGGDELAMALKMAVPLQLLAYHVASRRGLDADLPRNLAKSVTVE